MTTHAFRETGISVRLYKRGSRTWTASFRIEGRKIQRSTREESKDRAVGAAKAMVRDELRKELLDITPGADLTWSQLFDLYERERVPHMKPDWQRASRSRRGLFEACFGSTTPVSDFDQSDVDRFTHLRTTGTLWPEGQKTTVRAVRTSTIEADVRWLTTVLYWGVKKKVNGQRLLAEMPLGKKGDLEKPKPKQKPRRPVASHDRYVRTLECVDDIDPMGRLRTMLTIARHTGHRQGAICALRASDILRRPDDVRAALADQGMDERRVEHMPHGAILWRAENDKVENAHIVPISVVLREELDAYLAKNPRLGDAWLFPSPRSDTNPIETRQAGKWLVRAEALAELPKLRGGRWHPYRRLWANERKELPLQDVAAAGGWTDTKALALIYQKSDPETILRVVEAS